MTSSSNFGLKLGRISINVDFDGFIVSLLLSHQQFTLSKALLDKICKSSRLLLLQTRQVSSANSHGVEFKTFRRSLI